MSLLEPPPSAERRTANFHQRGAAVWASARRPLPSLVSRSAQEPDIQRLWAPVQSSSIKAPDDPCKRDTTGTLDRN